MKRIPVDGITDGSCAAQKDEESMKTTAHDFNRRIEEQKRNDQAVLDNAIGPRDANNERMPDWEEL